MNLADIKIPRDSDLIENKLTELKTVLLLVDKIYLRSIGLAEAEDESGHVDSFISLIRKGEKDWWNYGAVSLVTNALERVCVIAMRKENKNV